MNILEYYLVLAFTLSGIVGLIRLYEIYRYTHPSKQLAEGDEKCSHCKLLLTKSFKMSYGFEVLNIPRTYSCKRFWCILLRKLGYI